MQIVMGWVNSSFQPKHMHLAEHMYYQFAIEFLRDYSITEYFSFLHVELTCHTVIADVSGQRFSTLHIHLFSSPSGFQMVFASSIFHVT